MRGKERGGRIVMVEAEVDDRGTTAGDQHVPATAIETVNQNHPR